MRGQRDRGHGAFAGKGPDAPYTISIRSIFFFLVGIFMVVYLQIGSRTMKMPVRAPKLAVPFPAQKVTADLIDIERAGDHIAIAPGLISSSGFVQLEETRERGGLMSGTYELSLSAEPASPVAVNIVDPPNCTITSPSRLVFEKANWQRPRLVRTVLRGAAVISPAPSSCGVGIIHVLTSDDGAFHGLHIRLRITGTGARQLSARPIFLRPPPTPARTRPPTPITAQLTQRPSPRPRPRPRTRPYFPDATIALERMVGRSRSAFAGMLRNYHCVPTRSLHTRYECHLGKGEAFATKFYILAADKSSPEIDPGQQIVLIQGGVHGDEPSGSVAATHIQRHWIPQKGSILVVIDKINMSGLLNSRRRIKGARAGEADLNRNFPVDFSQDPKGPLAKAIWGLASLLRPDVLLDLHEGWGFYAQLKNNPHERLVGSKKFSKGSSVICTASSSPLAAIMVEKVNEGIDQQDRKFLIITPPISGGLAARLASVYGSLALVTETTWRSGDQPLILRATQQLIMVSAALKALGAAPPNFSPLDGAKIELCKSPGAEARLCV